MTPAAMRRVHAADLGLSRLRAATAAALTTVTAVGVLGVLAAMTDRGLGFVVPGVLLTSISTMLPGLDPDPRRRLGTMLLAPLAGVIGLLLGVLVSGSLIWTGVTFVGLVVVGLAVAALTGPRGAALGLTAIVVFYGTDLVNVPTTDLALQAVAVAGAGTSAVVVLGLVFAERSGIRARGLLTSLAALVDDLAVAVRRGRTTRARRTSRRLATAVAVSRAHLEDHPACWPASLRRETGAELGDLESRLGHLAERGADPAHAEQCAEAVRSEASRVRSWHADLPRRHRGSRRADRVRRTDPDPRREVDPGDLPPAAGGRPPLSMAVQLLVATILSLVAGMAIDDERWFWGVLAALVMLFGTSSAAEAIGKGGRRAVGTALALPVGVLVGETLAGRPPWIAAAMVLALFLQQYLAEIAYAASVFFLTVFISLVFTLAGAGSSQELQVRLVETAVGAAIGACVALVVLPTRTGPLLRGRALDVVTAAESTIDLVRDARPPTQVRAAARAAGRSFGVLEADALASRRGWPFSASHAVISELLASGAVVLRELDLVAGTYDDVARSSATRLAADRALEELRGIREDLLADDLTLASPPGRGPVASVVDPTAEASVADALTRLTGAVAHLRHVLAGR